MPIMGFQSLINVAIVFSISKQIHFATSANSVLFVQLSSVVSFSVFPSFAHITPQLPCTKTISHKSFQVVHESIKKSSDFCCGWFLDCQKKWTKSVPGKKGPHRRVYLRTKKDEDSNSFPYLEGTDEKREKKHLIEVQDLPGAASRGYQKGEQSNFGGLFLFMHSTLSKIS